MSVRSDLPALPRLLVLTDRRQCASAGHSLAEVLSAAAEGGARWFVLREKDLPSTERRELARSCLAAMEHSDAMLTIASDGALARELGGLPVHLAARDARPAAHEVPWWGRSCHDAPEVAAAVDEGARYALLSPVFPTLSKPGHGPHLGAAGLRSIASSGGDLSIYALGGITPENCEACLAAGARGVAVMSYVMSSSDPRTAVGNLLERLRGCS